MVILADDEINSLIFEEKTIPDGLCPLKKLTEINQHRRKEYEISCQTGNYFVIAIRQNMLNIVDFSVILGYRLPEVHTIFRLRRYNGKSITIRTRLKTNDSAIFISTRLLNAINKLAGKKITSPKWILDIGTLKAQ